ncbi:MAG: GNAT family N-acetyltransferase [Clostridiales bacterium]|nr:GNAT family N-acetyltransferase [Clostridiales bacterium]
MNIRRFTNEDAKSVSDLIRNTIKISNAKDYPEDIIELLDQTETPEHVIERAGWTHFYVVEEDGKIIGCGAIGPFWGKEDESSLFTIFVDPDYQGKGIGRSIVETLETDEFFLRAKRIEIPASITGVPFYRKLGYDYKDGITEPDDEHIIRLEKFRGDSVEFTYREKYKQYECEFRGICFAIEDEPEERDKEQARLLAENYLSHLDAIVEFMLPDIEEIYGPVTVEEVKEKLGTPTIDLGRCTVSYFEQSFDGDHIFEFEFMDDEFEDLDCFSIDG